MDEKKMEAMKIKMEAVKIKMEDLDYFFGRVEHQRRKAVPVLLCFAKSVMALGPEIFDEEKADEEEGSQKEEGAEPEARRG